MSKRVMLLTAFLAVAVLVGTFEASWAQGLLISSSRVLRGPSDDGDASLAAAVTRDPIRPVSSPDLFVRRPLIPPNLFRPGFTPFGRPVPVFHWPSFPVSLR